MNLGSLILVAGGTVATVVAAAFIRKLSRKLDRRLINTILVGLCLSVLAVVYLSYGLIAFLGALLLVGALGTGWVSWRRGGTAHTVTRWSEKSRRRSGVATMWQVARVGSKWAMHRKARAVRPHLRDLGWRERWRTPTRELGVELCRASGMKVWASCEDVVFICGGPRRGKTALLGNIIIDAPGAVVTTSTRTDVLEATQALRAQKGPTWTYNPGGLADLPSTISFDPTLGCEDPTVAIDRAADMIPEPGDEKKKDGIEWDAASRGIFSIFLHAVALSHGTRDCHDIMRWLSNPDAAADEVHLLLADSPVKSFATDWAQFVDLNPTTRSSICAGINPALRWLNSPSAVASTKAGTTFDVAELILSKGTVYLLGRHEANTAPLLAGLTGYIAREARRLAATPSFEGSCRGRLDPPITLPLDEVARVSPVPLPDWTGDFGGSGLQLIVVCQSRADLIKRYGEPGTAMILNNAGAFMYLGGNKDAAANGDLEFVSKLAGDRDEPVKTRNGEGRVTSTSVRKTPILPVAQLATLPMWKAVVFTGGMPVAIGRISRVWERADVKALARASRVTDARPVTHAVPLPPSTPTRVPSPTPVGAAPTRELTDAAH